MDFRCSSFRTFRSVEFSQQIGQVQTLANRFFSGEVGDRIESNITGRPEYGILICNSDMGITAMDLFNDILTNENDLTNFLHQNDVKNVSASSPGIIIQGKSPAKACFAFLF